MMQKVSQGPYRVIKTIELIVIEPKKTFFLIVYRQAMPSEMVTPKTILLNLHSSGCEGEKNWDVHLQKVKYRRYK